MIQPLPPLYCEKGGHQVTGAIYRAKAGDPFACAECIRKSGLSPKWLGAGR